MTWRHDLVGVSMMSMLALLVATGCGAEDGHTRAATERLAGDFAEGGAPISPADAATPGTSGKILYLANPYGFSAQQRAGPLQELVVALESLGAQVWEPFARSDGINPTSPNFAYRIGQANLHDVRDTDGLFAVVNGCPSDEGVMVEVGMAIAWEKPVFLFRDDFRRCTDSEAYPLNLMLFIGLPETGWEASWYTSVQELADPEKALAQWLNRL